MPKAKKKASAKSKKKVSSPKPILGIPSPTASVSAPPVTNAIPNPSNINDSFWTETREDLEQSAKNPFADVLRKNQMEMEHVKKNQGIVRILLVIILLVLLAGLAWLLF